MMWRFACTLFTMTILGGPVTVSAQVPTGKAYAVFMAAYNDQGDKARGGVAGTAFFVSSQKAITAFHVLNSKSFQPPAGFDHVKVWLVHEGEPAIELVASYIHPFDHRDQTVINLPRSLGVAKRFVFEEQLHVSKPALVVTEGFLANSVGPQFFHAGSELRIVSVPTLQRMRFEGELLRTEKVTLDAKDVRIHGAECFRLSYRPVVGFSGGPVLVNGKVIAMNSFAEPISREATWAVDLSGI